MSKLYGLRDYGGMIADEVRMSAHRAALARVVRPGSVVVDLGAGIGIMSLIACQLGARRVFAIEPNDLAEVARELAAANGFADRIRCHPGPLAPRPPPGAGGRAGVGCGEAPLHSLHIPTLVDARRRFLAPGGVVIPESDHVRVAVVSAPQAYVRSRAPWADGAGAFDMSAAERVAVNQLAGVKIAPDEVITSARTWASIDYRREPSPSTEGFASWVVDSNGGRTRPPGLVRHDPRARD